MYELYLNEFNNSKRTYYLQIQLNKHLILYQEYFNEYQVHYNLYKNQMNIKSSNTRYPIEKFVNVDASESFRFIGFGAFRFQNNETIYLLNLHVEEPFRRNYVALFLIKYFLEKFYPNREYNRVWGEARTKEAKELLSKIGFKKFNEDKEFNYWDMKIVAPKKIEFPKECNLTYITERVKNIN